ncbi:MAG: hypothetical protein COZ72_03225 [Elusimicrobia bacterium CG_4_8_14_3_um_filter_50_9]|nr:MAG: hypothetical protein COZ72_03225 [Elusimicrobia bacterium CG_4_8_14_3_um_filter_50_9]
MKKIKVAAVQMNSGTDVNKNFESVQGFVWAAAKLKAELLVFPEYCFYRGKSAGLSAAAEFAGKKALPVLRSLAEKHSLCIVAGSAPEAAPDNKFYNTSFVLARGKKQIVKYRKIHLFRSSAGKKIDERAVYAQGKTVSVFPFRGRRIGQALCFDLRFSSLFQKMSDMGADVIAMPSDFTDLTGRAHWEALVRARSIEWQTFMICPNQWGLSPATGIKSFGHSVITDPWGNILAQAPGRGNHLLLADIDFDFQKNVRRRIIMT